jgi:hypothetical protein
VLMLSMIFNVFDPCLISVGFPRDWDAPALSPPRYARRVIQHSSDIATEPPSPAQRDRSPSRPAKPRLISHSQIHSAHKHKLVVSIIAWVKPRRNSDNGMSTSYYPRVAGASRDCVTAGGYVWSRDKNDAPPYEEKTDQWKHSARGNRRRTQKELGKISSWPIVSV